MNLFHSTVAAHIFAVFGYQLHNLTPDRVRSIEVSGPDGWKIETAQSHPTVILFDNMKSVLNQKFTVTIELADVDLSQVTPPFIILSYSLMVEAGKCIW